jgi:hypothetical protein
MKHVACMGEFRSAYKVSVGKPEGKNHLTDLVVELKVTLQK